MIGRMLSFMALLWMLGFAIFVVLLPQPADDRATDAIVVLTGGPNRIGRGLDLLAAGRAKRMLVSGVDRSVRVHELAIENGGSQRLFACCIDLGREAVDTRSNADETARWLQRHRYGSVRLVTTDWHMARAHFELDHALAATPMPHPTILADAVRSEPSFGTLLNEYDKYLLRRASVLVGI